MPLHIPTDDSCPRCGKQIRFAVIESHPIRNDIARHSLQCVDCGPVKTKLLSLRPGDPPPELAA
jgi:hypothetical protein